MVRELVDRRGVLPARLCVGVQFAALGAGLFALCALVNQLLHGAIADDLLQPKHHGRVASCGRSITC